SFTADMLLRGTSHRSQSQLSDEIERLGASLSAQSNSDSSTISLQVLKKNADGAFDLLADVVKNPAFEPEEVERLRRERLTSVAQLRDDPGMLAEKALSAELYGSEHPYGYLEIGTEVSNKKISREDLSGFHSSAYTPRCAALVIVGDATEAEVRRLSETHFGDWSGSRWDKHLPEPRATRSRRVVIVDRPASPQTQLVMGQVGVARSHPDYVAIELMNTLLGGMFSSRINTNLREVHGYTYGAKSGFTYLRGRGPFLISAAVRTDATGASISEVFREIKQLRETLATAEELEIVKEKFSRALLSQFRSIRESTVSISGLFVHHLSLEHCQEMMERVSAV